MPLAKYGPRFSVLAGPLNKGALGIELNFQYSDNSITVFVSRLASITTKYQNYGKRR